MKDKWKTYVELEDRIIRLYMQVSSRKKSLAEIQQYNISDIQTYNDLIINGEYDPTDEGLRSILMLTLDQYTYSEDGTVFISDHSYDILHRLWQSKGHKPIIYADIFGSEWKMVHHDAPWMVGTVQKVYSLDELRSYINSVNDRYGSRSLNPVSWVVAPKFDGISANLKIQDNKLIQAITRGDRDMGQDITEVVRRCCNLEEILYWHEHANGYLKVELCVPSSEFEPLKAQGYANRRSATSAIVNSPKNIQNAKHIYAVPLLWYGEDGIDYAPLDSKMLKTASTNELINIGLDILGKVKSPEYEFRADGVVFYPMVVDMNTSDVMEASIAFKINTAKAYTRIVRGYVSMGRTGYAVPMIQVEPCDVNETVVTDVSLASFGKFYQLRLHERETVIVYSAGDVIPQMKPCDPPRYEKGSPYLEIPEICPYCGKELVNAHCVNDNCFRIKTGRITNFLQKLGAEDISDSTVELLYKNHIIQELPDILEIREDQLIGIDSIGEIKAKNIVSEIEKLRVKPISVSEFFGALGCPGVSEKISRTIFQVIPFARLLNEAKVFTPNDYYSDYELRDMLYSVSGIGENRANVILGFVAIHKSEIRKLLSLMNISDDVQYKGSIVFSGFRDKNWTEKFKAIRINVSESVTRSTLAVVASNLNTGKAKRAMELGIPIYLYADIDKAYEYCMKI